MFYRKKTLLAGSIFAALAAFIFFQSSAPPPANPGSFAQDPPIALKHWVRKISGPPPNYNMIMKVQFAPDSRLTSNIEISYVQDASVTFHDDGVAPDVTAGDRIYSAYIKENISGFLSQVTARQSYLQTQVTNYGGFLHFTGRAGELITEAPTFNVAAFNSFNEVELNALLLDAANCENDILKQHSLFITDLSVVENPVRTFNVVNPTGTNPTGAWTFGNLIKNMRNSATYGDTRTFLREWLSGWADGRTINGISVPHRERVFDLLIIPWLIKANKWNANDTTNPFLGKTASWDSLYWKGYWNATHEDSLLKYAPFKLMAIVNRIDLRENIGYSNSGQAFNSGETRFIYTLIAPINITGSSGGALAGYPPEGVHGEVDGSIDWKGMNVIFEYGNPQANRCQLRNFAQQWLDLSAYELGSEDYNAALEAITHAVIDAGAAPGKPNGSALNQLRTNEKIFFPSLDGNKNQPGVFASWEKADWQLSEFKLDATSHLLKPVPVANVPEPLTNTSGFLHLVDPSSAAFFQPISPKVTALLDWTFKNKLKINNGVHNLSADVPYSYGGNTFTQAAVADIRAEQLHYWDFSWDDTTAYYLPIPYSDPSRIFEKNVRQQLSLNTCQGCHAAETKTEFTMIRPVGYGQSQDYWSAVPAYDYAPIDTRFVKTLDSLT